MAGPGPEHGAAPPRFVSGVWRQAGSRRRAGPDPGKNVLGCGAGPRAVLEPTGAALWRVASCGRQVWSGTRTDTHTNTHHTNTHTHTHTTHTHTHACANTHANTCGMIHTRTCKCKAHQRGNDLHAAMSQSHGSRAVMMPEVLRTRGAGPGPKPFCRTSMSCLELKQWLRCVEAGPGPEPQKSRGREA